MSGSRSKKLRKEFHKISGFDGSEKSLQSYNFLWRKFKGAYKVYKKVMI